MRIGVDVRSLQERYHGGVSQYTRHLLDALLLHNRTHEYVLFSNSWKEQKNLGSWEKKNANVVHLRVPSKVLNSAFLLGVGPSIDNLLESIDVFWAPNLQFFSFSKKCKTVITCHDLSFEHYPEFFSLKRRLWHQCIRPKKLYKDFDKIVAVSESTAQDLFSLYRIPTSKVEVVHSGIHQEPVRSEDIARVRRRYHLPDSFVLTLGTLEPRKNLVSTLRAFDTMVDRYGFDQHLVVVGAPGWSYGQIHDELSSLKHSHRVHFLGYVFDRDRAPLYALADAFVWPSFYEGFGFPPLEALAQGTPVITSHHSSFPEVVGNAALLIDPYNIEDIVEAMYSVLVDGVLVQSLRRRGREVVNSFSWKQTAQSMERIFENVNF